MCLKISIFKGGTHIIAIMFKQVHKSRQEKEKTAANASIYRAVNGCFTERL
jgi:hypothetical protein